MSRAIFAAGCFWGVEDSFASLPGVLNTTVGYTGGTTENPTYQDVCSGTTGHAEAVEVEFDPQVISYEQLLDHFWRIHNPTTLNRQGPDIGSQYRSTIFYNDEQQQSAALTSKERTQQTLNNQIVTEVIPAGPFYRAEEYHQRYFAKQGRGSCRIF